MADFEWPWQYKFPPFFTLQPNTETRQKQLEAWRALILGFCRHHRVYIIDLAEYLDSPLFNNADIKRRLSEESIQAVLDELASTGHVEWIDKSKRRCYVFWRTPTEWGQLIYAWVTDSGMTGSVCTFFELTQGDDVADQPFQGLAEEVLLKALGTLQQAGKAEVMGTDGVKFF
ncbi:vacuolar protein-sorting-associated protein 25-like [Pollicipes pollicipes]|uniref:vacuolar protein-sorting-associated protein 25-like n=1 Tax=Pollicipes pollicipes TaxID=41117 RepID=UPI001884993E|nr:vacuolar protein-sorting-associated protein 25-like [Pollicipes pollicipes]